MHLLSFHTVFILNENIRWLEEFIEYYLTIGFDHFYLYHNEGTIGLPNEGDEHVNKYGMPRITKSTLTDIEQLNNILEKYRSYITYIKWQPTDQSGNIIYGYNESVKHFISNFRNQTKWIACMDLDEYLYSPSYIDIREYFQNIQPNISSIVLCQKKFKDRHISTKTKILEEYECINEKFGDWWGRKHIFRPNDLTNIIDMHSIEFKYEAYTIDQELLRFNHYNVNNYQLNWMSGAFGKNYSLDAIDDGMKRYLKTD
jgi:hypothetical protein